MSAKESWTKRLVQPQEHEEAGTWPLNALDQGGSRPGHGRPAVDEPLVNPAGWPQSRCGLVFTYPRKTAARRTETRSVHRGR